MSSSIFLASDAADSVIQDKKIRIQYSLNERQLYTYACHYYVHDGGTYFDACEKAIEKHPELVPNSWSENSAAETLRTRVSQKYDKHLEWSQKDYRNHR